MKFDNKGVSALVGFILLMMIAMVLLSTLQSLAVPKICKKYEGEAMEEYVKSFTALPSKLLSGNPEHIELSGVNYPKYMFLLTPPSASYTILTKNFYIKLKFDAILPNGSVKRETMVIPSKRIILTPNFNYYPKDELIFENFVSFRKIGSKYITLGGQEFIASSLNILGITGKDLSYSTSYPTTLIFKPISVGHVEAKNITVSFSSVNPEYWKSLGATVNGSNVNFSIGSSEINFRIYLLSSEEVFGSYNYSNKKLRIFMLEDKNVSLMNGESTNLGIVILDEYFSPVSGVNVEVKSDIGKVVPEKLKTNYDGKAEVRIFANRAGKGNVTFVTPYGNVTYHVDVKSESYSYLVSGFNVKWIDKKYVDSYYGNEWNATAEGTAKNFEIQVLYKGCPVSNAVVNFALTNSSVLEIEKNSNITNSSGIAVVNVRAKKDGEARIFGYCGSGYDVLNLSIIDYPFWWDSNWKCRVPINITSNYELSDYQILVILNSDFDWKNVSTNGSDIRFVDSYSDSLPYWIEYWNYGKEAWIWVKVYKIHKGENTIYMYYGNPSAKSKSNGESTFIFFDNFSTWSGWYKLWNGNVYPSTFDGKKVLLKNDYDDPNGGWKSLGTTISNFRMLVMEYRPSTPSTYGGYDRYCLADDENNGYGIIRYGRTPNYGAFGIEKRVGGSGNTLISKTLLQPYNNWYITELEKYDNILNASIYDSQMKLIGSVSTSDSQYNIFTRFEVRGGHPYYLNWVAVAKYVLPSPKVTVGNPEYY